MILFLVGYAGSGKTTMAKRLGRRLGCMVVDTDKRVEKEEGATIADIFYYQGEEYFRQAERHALEGIGGDAKNTIVATGGGLPTWGDNMAWMREHGVVVYLRRSAEQILARLSDYGREKRPLFRGKSDEELLEFMREHMLQREIYYAEADIVVECDHRSDDDVVEEIVNELNIR
ncbi:MAG: AAA family ATPase [Alistipes sp.]|nr:AAA family ATPase [Alistipes sp.]MBO7306660.1 AAA family ATPase [Alistipes sp.]